MSKLLFSFERDLNDAGQNELFSAWHDNRAIDMDVTNYYLMGLVLRARVVRIFQWSNGNCTAVLQSVDIFDKLIALSYNENRA